MISVSLYSTYQAYRATRLSSWWYRIAKGLPNKVTKVVLERDHRLARRLPLITDLSSLKALEEVECIRNCQSGICRMVQSKGPFDELS